MSAFPAFDQPALHCEPGQYPVSRRRRNDADLTHIRILNDIVALQEPLDLFPAFRRFIF